MESQQKPGGRGQRRHPRASFYTEVWLGQEGVFTRSVQRLSDVSIGGAFIETPQAYAVGTVLSLRFALGSNFITATVIIRNVRSGKGFGVEFLDLSPENRELLGAVCRGAG